MLKIDRTYVGDAKAFNLALMKKTLGTPVPGGFAITAYAFERFLQENDLRRGG